MRHLVSVPVYMIKKFWNFFKQIKITNTFLSICLFRHSMLWALLISQGSCYSSIVVSVLQLFRANRPHVLVSYRCHRQILRSLVLPITVVTTAITVLQFQSPIPREFNARNTPFIRYVKCSWIYSRLSKYYISRLEPA